MHMLEFIGWTVLLLITLEVMYRLDKWGSLMDAKLLKYEPDTLILRNQDKEVIRVDPVGRVFWHGREVETDEDFRGAMMEMREYFMGRIEICYSNVSAI